MPCDLDAERVLLASLLVDADPAQRSLKLCTDLNLQPRAFYEPKHQLIYTACLEVAKLGQQPDELTVSNYLRTNLQLDYAGGVPYINELGSQLFAPSPNLRPAADLILKHQHTRDIIGFARELQGKALSGAFTPDELVASFTAQAKTLQLSSSSGTSHQKFELSELRSVDRNADPNNLIGKRWLCRGGSLLFSGQAGTGKSSLLTTLIIHFALGRQIWGLKPVKPLRVVLLQSENDAYDLAEQWQDVTASLNLTQADIELLDQQVYIYREAIKTGEAFGQLIEDLCKAHSADLLVVDPLLGFAGGDVSKQDFCSHFLRQILQPCLMRCGVALIAAHHQNKPPRKKEDQNSMSSTYDFTGSSELANWFRSTAILRREDSELPHFILKLGKRGNRAGMVDANGSFTESLRIRHSKVRGQIKWELNLAPPPEDKADL